MKKLALITMIGLAVTAGVATAEKVEVTVAASQTVTVVGTVVVTTNEAGEVKAVAIKTAEKTIAVVLDEIGAQLAELNGKKVSVQGVLTDGALKVESCEEVAAE